jgi:hypothetical protein
MNVSMSSNQVCTGFTAFYEILQYRPNYITKIIDFLLNYGIDMHEYPYIF